jgi:FMN reductase
MTAPVVVGIGGTTRLASTSERLVRAVLEAVERRGARTQMFCGQDLAKLPHYAPENPQRSPEQVDMVEAVRGADAIVIGTPGYHGGVSGLVKNAIDLLEDLRADRRCYFEGRPVGLLVTAAGWQSCGVTLSALRDIVHALRGWPTPLGLVVNTVADNPFDAEGVLRPGDVREGVEIMARQLLGARGGAN